MVKLFHRLRESRIFALGLFGISVGFAICILSLGIGRTLFAVGFYIIMAGLAFLLVSGITIGLIEFQEMVYRKFRDSE